MRNPRPDIDLASYAELFIGKKEDFGRNDGPEIREWKRLLGPGVESAKGIAWCAIYVTAMVMLRNGLNRAQLLDALGWPRKKPAYFESCDWWLSAGLSNSVPGIQVVDEPARNDIGLLHARRADGSYIPTDARHIWIYRGVVNPHDDTVPTIEGNTVPGFVEGSISREGVGVYSRFRSHEAKRQTSLRLLPSLVEVHA